METPEDVRRAIQGTYAAFIGCGVLAATWASRIPQVRDQLHLTPSSLGLVLLTIALGSVLALPLSGGIVNRWDSRRTVGIMVVVDCLALAGASLGYLFGVAPVVICLFILGFAWGTWDVAMNVQGAAVERRFGRSIMPRFHAGYSVGTVAGALLGVAMVALHVPVTLHLTLVAAVVGVVVSIQVRHFLVESKTKDLPDEIDVPSPPGGALVRWRELRTVLIGVFVLAFAFTEGTGIDWINVAMIDGYHAAPALGTLALALFLAGMTGARWFGPGLLDRYGRVTANRGLAVVAGIGLVIFVFGHLAVLAFVGVLLWGIGASLGFPVGMSAASDDPVASASRVSVVASIGYCAFLGGPPTIGFLGDRFTVLHALLVVAILLTMSAFIAGELRPLPVTERRAIEPSSAD